MDTIINWMRKHSLLTYFILAYTFSWFIGIPLALRAQGMIQMQIPFSLHYLIAYGPLLSALIVTGLTAGGCLPRPHWCSTSWLLACSGCFKGNPLM